MKKMLVLALVILGANVLFAKTPTLVITTPVEDGNLAQGRYFVGSLYFEERSNLASEVSGVIETIYVKEGERVKQGQKLALLNSDLLDLQIQSQEALLRQSKALLDKTAKDFERFNKLYKSNSISFKEYENALFDLRAQRGSADAIEADLKKLKKERDKKELKSPYDGVILSQSLKRGEWVNVGASLFSIAKLSPLEATFEVPFDVLRSLKVGQKIEVLIASKQYNASIAALIPLGDAKARTFPIKLAIEDPYGELIEGLEVRAKLFKKGLESGLLVPRDAILPSNNGNIIFVVRESKAVQVDIEVQQYSSNLALVRSKKAGFLKVGEKVITKGHERLKNGDEIKE
ncbi:efflux transporter periplasmic adaptor subunit [Helicobacter monodelphidis]|uniref:efflux RND transporter periplasmic adaptor subunit n=1 Tax=Helicobacter sp. 15-1451 TaxID=2004995 RepID=UPI000DCE3C16|nr:efflux RND transporter periplasmic adaptor subunit [Helicobacter sp. 15-1451]RAX57622.1 efflux transporter periplasmic adaptor subunit [Helicobacter sp. 15-1451]